MAFSSEKKPLSVEFAKSIIDLVKTRDVSQRINITIPKRDLVYIENYYRDSVRACSGVASHFRCRGHNSIHAFLANYNGNRMMLNLFILFREAVQTEEMEEQEKEARIEAMKLEAMV